MIQQVKTAYMYLIVMGVAVTLFMLSIMVPIVSSDADFSIYNRSWNGCSDFLVKVYENGSFVPTVDVAGSTQDRIQHEKLNELGDLKERETTIIIIGPQTSFDDEIEFLDDFVDEGGLLVIADDFGSGSALLEALETETRISTMPMNDLAFEMNMNFPVTTEMSDHPITKDVSMVVLNIPSTISPSKKAIPIFNSSVTSWIDLDNNDVRDDNEPAGPFPLMTYERIGKGELIVLSDPSILINGMNDDEPIENDNEVLVSNLIGFITENRNTTIIDEAHRDVTDPVSVTNQVVSLIQNDTQKVMILIFISLIFIILNTSYPKRAVEGLRNLIDRLLAERPIDRGDERSVIDIVMEKHPDWDSKLLDRIVKDIEGSQ